MNRSVNSAAAEKRRISGIHDGIDLELRDVTAGNVDLNVRAQNVSDRSSGRSRRQSSVYFTGPECCFAVKFRDDLFED